MANVLLTTRCNLRCTYCFAQEKLQDDRNQMMSMNDVNKVIAFLKQSDHSLFRVMGGEPTLHPQFPGILQAALAAGMCVDILSNATWPEDYNSLFARVSPRRLGFLLNIDHPDNYASWSWNKIENNLAAVSRSGNVTLSFNIFQTKPRYEYVFELLKRFHIHNVRLSFSLPVLGAGNTCLRLDEYGQVAGFIMDFVRQAEELGVQVRLDNAVPLCVFSFEQAGELLVKGVLDLKHNMRCDPVIDIGPDLTVWCCFCLSPLWNRRLDEFQNLQEIHAYYARAMALYQNRLFPMEKCHQCRFRDLCQGGCLTHTIVKHGELQIDPAPALQPDGGPQDTVVSLAQDVHLRHYDLPVESYALSNVSNGMEFEVDPSFHPLLTMLNGEYSRTEVADRFVDTSQADLDGPIRAFAESAMRKGVNTLLLNLLHEQLLVEQPVAQACRRPQVDIQQVHKTI
jgi:radical SAM protein with 4Fe4S-binding SPASM domain